MRRLAIFTIIGILALAGCSGSGCLTDGSGGSSPAVSPTAESDDGGGKCKTSCANEDGGVDSRDRRVHYGN